MAPSQYPDHNPIPRVIIIAGFAAVLFKLWMIGGHDIFTKIRPHDDSLFAHLAVSLLEGEWLGEYNNKTLIKGIGYPVFMALSFLLDIPLFTLQHLLYALASLLLVLAIRPVTKSPWILLTGFVLLLFSPNTYTYPLMSQTMREGLYGCLIIWVFASILGMWFYRGAAFRTNLAWSLSAGISLSWLWVTREESVWIIPGLLLFLAVYLYPWKPAIGPTLIQRVGYTALPCALLAALLLTILNLNDRFYSAPLINELKSSQFNSALGELMRIRHEKFERHVVVSRDAQNKAFEASPSFAELRPHLDKESSMPASFYIWSLRSAVRKAGYYDDPQDARRTLNLYARIGSELNAACASGELDCHDRKASIRPVFHPSQRNEIVPTFLSLTAIALTQSDFNPFSSSNESIEGIDTLLQFQILTGEDTMARHEAFQALLPDYHLGMLRFKETAMALVGKLYSFVVPVLFIAALVFHLLCAIQAIRMRRGIEGILLGCVLLGSAFALLAILTYVKITLWPVDRPLNAVIPVLLCYIVFSLAVLSPRRANSD